MMTNLQVEFREKTVNTTRMLQWRISTKSEKNPFKKLYYKLFYNWDYQVIDICNPCNVPYDHEYLCVGYMICGKNNVPEFNDLCANIHTYKDFQQLVRQINYKNLSE